MIDLSISSVINYRIFYTEKKQKRDDRPKRKSRLVAPSNGEEKLRRYVNCRREVKLHGLRLHVHQLPPLTHLSRRFRDLRKRKRQ